MPERAIHTQDIFRRRIERNIVEQAGLGIGTILTLLPNQEQVDNAVATVSRYGGETIRAINTAAPLEPKTIGAIITAASIIPVYNAVIAARQDEQLLTAPTIQMLEKEPLHKNLAKGAVKTAAAITAMYGANKLGVHFSELTDIATDLGVLAAGAFTIVGLNFRQLRMRTGSLKSKKIRNKV